MTARTQPVLLFALSLAFLSACTTVNHPSVSSDDLASRLGVPEYATEVHGESAGTFTNFCTQKECEGAELRYSVTFRKASILLLAIGELERQTEVATLQAEPTAFLEAAAVSIPDLRRDVDSTRRRLALLSPLQELRSAKQQKAAIDTLLTLNQGLDLAHGKLGRVEQVLQHVIVPAKPMAIWAPNNDTESLNWAEFRSSYSSSRRMR